MVVTRKIVCDISVANTINIVHVLQNDTNTRVVEAVMLDNGVAWTVPSGYSASLAFRKPDGTKGWYDALPNKEPAVHVSSNVISITLAPQVTVVDGNVHAAIILRDASRNQIGSFPFVIKVFPNPAAGHELSNDYWDVSDLEALNKKIEDHIANLDNPHQVTAEQIGGGGANKDYIDNNFAPVIKETITGTTVSTDMVSPIEHDVECNIGRVNLCPPVGEIRESKRIKFISPLTPGSYYLSAEEITASAPSPSGYLAYFLCDDGSRPQFLIQSGHNGGKTITIPSTCPEVVFYPAEGYHSGRTGTWNGVQLTEGAEQKDYVPYIPDLSSVTVSRYGKNILTLNASNPETFHGITYTPNPDGSISVDGTKIGLTFFNLNYSKNSMGVPHGKYIVSGANSNVMISCAKNGVQTFTTKSKGIWDVTPDYVDNWTRLQVITDGEIHERIYPMIRLQGANDEDDSFEKGIAPVTYKPSPSGEVTGMKSISPSMTILTDNPSANLEVTYNVDTKKFVEAHSGGGGESDVTKEYVDQQDADTLQQSKEYGNNTFASISDGAGYHNSVYRGKNLGSAVTPEQYARIKDGTFKDLYIGDYWTIDGVSWRIAAFDYFLWSGNTPCTEHHAVMVPDTNLYNHKMNNSKTTQGGYVGSDMYTSGLTQAKNTIKNAFASHVLNHRLYLSNATSQGYASGTVWVDSEVDLMTESMVYGGGIFSPVGNGSFIPANYIVETSQLPLFTFRQDLISSRQWYWLRDIVTPTRFSFVDGYGDAAYLDASYDFGVRPYFCIYGGEV